MTEIKETDPIMKLVLHWGEMGTRWGINRTVAQIHALLHFSARPWTAEEICQALDVARSHVSNSLKELQAWGVVNVVHVLGDRRDHFQAIQDVWQLFEKLLDERKRREMDPTLKLLRETAACLDPARPDQTDLRHRVGQMLEFFETMDGWYAEIRRMPLSSRMKLVKLGSKLLEWLK